MPIVHCATESDQDSLHAVDDSLLAMLDIVTKAKAWGQLQVGRCDSKPEELKRVFRELQME
jgi:hypothetical protein